MDSSASLAAVGTEGARRATGGRPEGQQRRHTPRRGCGSPRLGAIAPGCKTQSTGPYSRSPQPPSDSPAGTPPRLSPPARWDTFTPPFTARHNRSTKILSNTRPLPSMLIRTAAFSNGAIKSAEVNWLP